MKDILIVVDMQEGFVHSEKIRELVSNIKRLLEADVFDVVIATKFINTKDSMFEKYLSWSDLEIDEEQQICQELSPYINAITVKNYYSGVNEQFLMELATNNDGTLPDRVFLVGVDTDCCVLATAVSLFENNIRPIVLPAYTGSTGGEEAHQAGVRCLERLIGKKQIYTDVEITKDIIKKV